MQKRKSRSRLRKADPLFAEGGTVLALVLAIALWKIATPSVVVAPNTSNNFSLGQYYFNAGDSEYGAYDLPKAQAYYQAALVDDPANPWVWYQLGRIDFLQSRFIAAIYKFNKQIEKFGDEIPSVHYMLGLSYAYQAQISEDPADWSQAENEFLKYVTLDPTAPWPRVDLAWVYFSQGKYEDMIPVLEEGMAQNPNQPWLLNMYGLALLNTGRQDEAKDAFLKAKLEAGKLSIADWGKAYPGNDPKEWKEGLDSFKAAIDKNLALAHDNE